MGVTHQDGDDVMGMLALEELIFATGGTWNLSAVQDYGINYKMMPSIQMDAANPYNWGATECIVKMHRDVTEAEQNAIFDYDKLYDTPSYENPVQMCDGIEYVIVGGKIVYHDKKTTGEYPGKIL